ncbi:maleylpyruvate isomerase family mycothiol-dependent enzyme [Saccharopolyspora sp. NPDC002686]|uniref:maleylpyruvate isomerase family mycothiol-dependent enzyme n=1 Tax=Saccharopolyspora sp. NPDC002686 TaxID=3154541 RepID=UPI00333064DA
MDVKQFAGQERLEFAEFLATLSEQEWSAPTLCSGWSVHDVVAHALSYEELDGRAAVRRVAKGLLVPSRINELGVVEYRKRSPEELVALMRASRQPRGLTARFGGRIALVDGMIHQQDIRRPLGKPREIPPDRLVAALRFALVAPPIRAFWRVRGLRLVATDFDWASGRGLEVRGRGEALLMAAAGRSGVVGELSGPGQRKLAERVEGRGTAR